MNDDGIPIFYRGQDRPQVLDLLWLHEDASLKLMIDIAFNIFGPAVDHCSMSLICKDHFSDSCGVPNLSQCFLLSWSDEELILVIAVLVQMDACMGTRNS